LQPNQGRELKSSSAKLLKFGNALNGILENNLRFGLLLPGVSFRRAGVPTTNYRIGWLIANWRSRNGRLGGFHGY
jgi:hypothetical protein